MEAFLDDHDDDREVLILAGIERRNRRMVRATVALLMFIAVVVAGISILPEPQDPAEFTRIDAVRVVLDGEPAFADAVEFSDGMIGVSDYWTATKSTTGWTVTVRLGWGDCAAGCISQHTFVYETSATRVDLVESYGDPLSTRPAR